MNLREEFEKETGNQLQRCYSEDAVLKYWIDYSKWLEQRNKEQVEVLKAMKEMINDVASDDYIFEDDWDEDAHIAKVTVTVKDARSVINQLKKSE